MIRRGGVTDVPRFLARLEIKCLNLFNTSPRCNYDSAISQLRVLSKPHRKFGVCSSRRLGIRGLAIGEVPFLE